MADSHTAHGTKTLPAFSTTDPSGYCIALASDAQTTALEARSVTAQGSWCLNARYIRGFQSPLNI